MFRDSSSGRRNHGGGTKADDGASLNRRQPGLPRVASPASAGDDSEQNVQLDRGVPIYISYLTVRVDGDKLVYADDVYGLDKPGATQVVKVAADGDSAAQ